MRAVSAPDITGRYPLLPKHMLKRLRNSYDGEGRLIEHSIGCYNTALHRYTVSYDT
ncbi:hypothetical protein [Paenibacillus sp. FSL E2-0178]|uniref:hypothetical protein n=1 Tax=Paenibacillus sp. FSL E2-0178 TaxID=2921361 RepID=UPI0031589A94